MAACIMAHAASDRCLNMVGLANNSTQQEDIHVSNELIGQNRLGPGKAHVLRHSFARAGRRRREGVGDPGTPRPRESRDDRALPGGIAH
jgi:hypothetical protein